VHRASMRDFLGDPDSCSLARAAVVAGCPACGGCSAHDAGCGVLELPPTVPPTTTIPPGGPCKAVCDLGGQKATCEDRMAWSVEHVFINKPDACAAAHDMVSRQCPVCGKCRRSAISCVDEETLAAQKAEEEAARHRDLFDCVVGGPSVWSGEKQRWCCEHKRRGCEGAPLLFRQKFDRTLPASRLRGGRRLEVVLLVVVGVAAGFVGLLVGARASASHRHSQHLPTLLSAELEEASD